MINIPANPRINQTIPDSVALVADAHQSSEDQPHFFCEFTLQNDYALEFLFGANSFCLMQILFWCLSLSLQHRQQDKPSSRRCLLFGPQCPKVNGGPESHPKHWFLAKINWNQWNEFHELVHRMRMLKKTNATVFSAQSILCNVDLSLTYLGHRGLPPSVPIGHPTKKQPLLCPRCRPQLAKEWQ